MKSLAVMAVALLGLASAVNVDICKHQTKGDCVTIDVNGCTNFPGGWNDQVSSVDTGAAECVFYENGSCGGGAWTTRGRQNTIPGNWNDKFSSVRC
ncbi:Putative gamma-crystallin [Colletotrichum destructivum]|uniref:Gamma-crystallin n=1 Tax=Colletotrichum destructivum TaxID=34406 RepID=A0AAX4IFE9_9PEZI|nr:Putative gamma-crystallin [Colletotrichum destructivum]